MGLIKMLSVRLWWKYVQILEQIFDSEVIRNYLYLSNLPQWVKKKNCTWKKKDISEQYVSITRWVIFFEKWQGYFFSLSFLFFLQKNKNDVYRFPPGSNWPPMFCMWVYYNEKWAPYFTWPVLKEATRLTFERSINLLENVTSSNICHSCWTQRCPLFRGICYLIGRNFVGRNFRRAKLFVGRNFGH